MPEIEIIDKSFKIDYIPHKTRFKNVFLDRLFVFGFFLVLILYKLLTNQHYTLSLLLIFIFGVALLFFGYMKYHHNPMTFINKIRIENNQIIISGYNFDTVWHEHLDIHETKLKIVGIGGGRSSNIEYYLLFTSKNKSFKINDNKKWNYFDIYEIFTLFYKIKNEIPRLEDRLMIDYIEKKAHGISTFDMIWRHKEIKR